MTGPWQPPDDQGYWRAPPPRPEPDQPRPEPEESDFLLSESRGTRPEAPQWQPPVPDQPRAPRIPLHLAPVVAVTTKQSVHRLLGAIEARRLDTVLNGVEVRNVGSDDEPELALRHRHWVGLLFRLLGAGAAFVAAVLIPNAIIALILLAGVHAGVLFLRRGVATVWALVVGGAEFVIGWLISYYIGPEWLRATLIVATLVMIGLTVLAWRVDMELVTESRLLIRTQGLLLLKRTVQAPLASIRIADVTGPFLGLGYVSVDTTSDRDQLLHNFGLISSPNEWTALLLREASRPSQAASAATD